MTIFLSIESSQQTFSIFRKIIKEYFSFSFALATKISRRNIKKATFILNCYPNLNSFKFFGQNSSILLEVSRQCDSVISLANLEFTAFDKTLLSYVADVVIKNGNNLLDIRS